MTRENETGGDLTYTCRVVGGDPILAHGSLSANVSIDHLTAHGCRPNKTHKESTYGEDLLFYNLRWTPSLSEGDTHTAAD